MLTDERKRAIYRETIESFGASDDAMAFEMAFARAIEKEARKDERERCAKLAQDKANRVALVGQSSSANVAACVLAQFAETLRALEDV